MGLVIDDKVLWWEDSGWEDDLTLVAGHNVKNFFNYHVCIFCPPIPAYTGVSLGDKYQVNWLPVRTILQSCFDYLEEGFSYKGIQKYS